MKLPSSRLANGIGFLICASLLGYAYYAQFSDNLEPCPLCIFQRIGVIALAVLFVLAALHNPARIGARVYAVLIGLASIGGGAVAARHVYLQHLPPDQVPECGPGLEYMLDVFPLGEALQQVFKGSGECADVSWTFLTLSMPSWVLIWFVALGVAGVVRNWTR